ncbi:hypothetical protein C8F01DRAFT_1087193 [Mycena amicta]|nr:hypothetical protein C8F01DRAFT_1087193 [Mycena amicta]
MSALFCAVRALPRAVDIRHSDWPWHRLPRCCRSLGRGLSDEEQERSGAEVKVRDTGLEGARVRNDHSGRQARVRRVILETAPTSSGAGNDMLSTFHFPLVDSTGIEDEREHRDGQRSSDVRGRFTSSTLIMLAPKHAPIVPSSNAPPCPSTLALTCQCRAPSQPDAQPFEGGYEGSTLVYTCGATCPQNFSLAGPTCRKPMITGVGTFIWWRALIGRWLLLCLALRTEPGKTGFAGGGETAGAFPVHFFVKCCPLEPARLWSPLSIHPTVRSESAVAQCSTFSTVTPTALSSTSAVMAQCTPTSTSTFALTHDTHCIDPVGSSLGSESTPATLPCHRCPSSVARLPCAVVAVALAMSGGFLAWDQPYATSPSQVTSALQSTNETLNNPTWPVLSLSSPPSKEPFRLPPASRLELELELGGRHVLDSWM